MESNQKMEEKRGDGGYKSDNIHKARLISTLTALLEDPLLSDVPKDPSLSDVDNLISLELGSAMCISVLKFDGTAFGVVVMNSATVKDLKLAIMKKVNGMEQSKMGHRHISWRHVWANCCLSYDSEKLIDDPRKLQDFGIRNNSQVQFMHFVVSRVTKRHSKGEKASVLPWPKQAMNNPTRFYHRFFPITQKQKQYSMFQVCLLISSLDSHFSKLENSKNKIASLGSCSYFIVSHRCARWLC